MSLKKGVARLNILKMKNSSIGRVQLDYKNMIMQIIQFLLSSPHSETRQVNAMIHW